MAEGKEKALTEEINLDTLVEDAWGKYTETDWIDQDQGVVNDVFTATHNVVLRFQDKSQLVSKLAEQTQFTPRNMGTGLVSLEAAIDAESWDEFFTDVAVAMVVAEVVRKHETEYDTIEKKRDQLEAEFQEAH
ncbi:hypothetical protein HYZ70_01440 [Candidatus Curtissbacteria bacterium]|nr:hypothetical protein [Candidatus Curtissbacteria bacterium]